MQPDGAVQDLRGRNLEDRGGRRDFRARSRRVWRHQHHQVDHINGTGTLAGILGAGANGVIVNAGPNDIVTLRNISMNGAGTSLSGIRYLAGGTLIVQNVDISGFTSVGIDMSLSASGRLFVSNSTIRVNAVGVRMLGSSGTLRASLEHVRSSARSGASTRPTATRR